MEIIIHNSDTVRIAEITANEIIISNTQDALDIMAEADQLDAKAVLVYEQNVTPEFFNLRTGLAGEILQKFVNYGFSMAVVGDFSKYPGKSLAAFILECNRGNQFLFVMDKSEVFRILSGTLIT